MAKKSLQRRLHLLERQVEAAVRRAARAFGLHRDLCDRVEREQKAAGKWTALPAHFALNSEVGVESIFEQCAVFTTIGSKNRNTTASGAIRIPRNTDSSATVLRPPIKPSEARHALTLLLKLGLLERAAGGRLRQSNALVATGSETRGMHIRNYHAEMMRRATEAMELVPQAERDISSLTMCLAPDGLARFKQRIQEFQRELLELAEHEPARSQAVQINFQLFPLSESIAPPRRAVRGAGRSVEVREESDV